MQEQTAQDQQSEEQPGVPSIEYALDRLVNEKPKSGEKTSSFVRRCVSGVLGKNERRQLFAVVMESLAELGLKATTPASAVSKVLAASFEEASAAA